MNKKAILALIILIAQLMFLFSCDKEPSISVEPAPKYTADDLTVFEKDLAAEYKNAENYPLYMYDQSENFYVVPILVSSKYKFHMVEVSLSEYSYKYFPVEDQNNLDKIIVVKVSRSRAYEKDYIKSVASKYNYPLYSHLLYGEIAYREEGNIWVAMYDDFFIEVNFPDKLKIKAEEFNDYFTFETKSLTS